MLRTTASSDRGAPAPALLRSNAVALPHVPGNDGSPAPLPMYLPWQPSRQVIWDATSLRTFLECPRKYHYKHLEGWMAPEVSMDLLFGQALGTGLETFYKEIIENGSDHDTALRLAIRACLEASWDHVANRPRMGHYAKAWRCLGTVKYTNEKGNYAKCPWSHKGKWFPAPGPTPCSCGSETTTAWRWVPEHKAKDRVQLIRALVWYTEEQKESALKPIALEAHPERPTPTWKEAAVELPFLVPFTKIGGVPYFLCGWWDSVKQLGGPDGPAFVTDYKTTKNSLGADYWRGWQPNVQVDLYDLVASRYSPVPVDGVGIEAIQVGVGRDGEGWVRFGYRNYSRSPAHREEFAQELTVWFAMAASYSQNAYWPMNRASCKLCEFKDVCNMVPEQRGNYLAEHFTRGRWNPMTRKVEIPDDRKPLLEPGRMLPAPANRLPMPVAPQGRGQQEVDERGAIAGSRNPGGMSGPRSRDRGALTLVPRDDMPHRQEAAPVLQPAGQDGSPST